jgi:hypothetical protein
MICCSITTQGAKQGKKTTGDIVNQSDQQRSADIGNCRMVAERDWRVS